MYFRLFKYIIIVLYYKNIINNSTDDVKKWKKK